MSIGNDLKRTLAQFTYLKCIIVFNEEMKKRTENKKKKTREKALPFF